MKKKKTERIHAFLNIPPVYLIPYPFSPQWLGEDSGDGDNYQQLHGTDYENLRQEASMYYKLRHESFQKAQEAYRRGLKPLASWYSQVVSRV